MNAASFAYVGAEYTNPSAAGIAGWWDVLIGPTGEVLFDQKMMGMFSLLLGASLVLFVERAAGHTAHPRRLSP
jgi:Predicted membrane protein